MNPLTFRVIYDEYIAKLDQDHLTLSENVFNDFIHLLNHFGFHPTTPSSRVGRYIRTAFFSASRDQDILLVTNQGVRSSKHSRIAHKDLPFLTQTPIVSGLVVYKACEFIGHLK